MESQLRDPEALLEAMFLLRHELITARTMAAQCHDSGCAWPASTGSTDDVGPGYAPTSPTSSTGCARSPTASPSSSSA